MLAGQLRESGNNLKKGLKEITVHTLEIELMNYDYINFELVKLK